MLGAVKEVRVQELMNNPGSVESYPTTFIGGEVRFLEQLGTTLKAVQVQELMKGV